jgi:hypothetical protein
MEAAGEVPLCGRSAAARAFFPAASMPVADEGCRGRMPAG